MSTLTLMDPTAETDAEAVAMINEVGRDDHGFQGLADPLNLQALPAYVAKLQDEARGAWTEDRAVLRAARRPRWDGFELTAHGSELAARPPCLWAGSG